MGRGASLSTAIPTLSETISWKALQALSDPTPSIQLARLQGFYQDLHVALKSLLTPQHPVLTTFSSPLSPTPSPLRSAVTHLCEALRSLRQKCAPVRDEMVDGLLSKLEDPPNTQLPSVIVDVVRSMLELADIMKDDLTEVVLGSVGEEHLEAVVRCNARDEEKALVLKFWGLSGAKDVWIRWIYDYESPPSAPPPSQGLRRLWVSRLLTALTTNVPIIVEIPIDPVVPSSEGGTEPNPLSDLPPSPKPSAAILPPFFMMASSTLWYLQNSIQMVVILACLRSLVRLPNNATSNTPEYDFINRVWTILQSVLGDRGRSEVTLDNLADEVVRIRQRSGAPLDTNEEARLRDAVRRIIDIDNQVFLLLQKRLMEALKDRLAPELPLSPKRVERVAPNVLHTGRRRTKHSMNSMKLILEEYDVNDRPNPPREEQPLIAKGFEDPNVVGYVTDLVKRLRGCIDWVEWVWSEEMAIA